MNPSIYQTKNQWMLILRGQLHIARLQTTEKEILLETNEAVVQDFKNLWRGKDRKDHQDFSKAKGNSLVKEERSLQVFPTVGGGSVMLCGCFRFFLEIQ